MTGGFERDESIESEAATDEYDEEERQKRRSALLDFVADLIAEEVWRKSCERVVTQK